MGDVGQMPSLRVEHTLVQAQCLELETKLRAETM